VIARTIILRLHFGMQQNGGTMSARRIVAPRSMIPALSDTHECTRD
jgi:hypothetical protein